MFSGFPSENVVLYKMNGEASRKVDALVEPDHFFIEDASIVVEEGDCFERTLPNGAKEYYRVVDRGYFKGMGSFSDHYQTVVKKISKMEMDQLLSKETKEDVKLPKKPHKLFISHSSKDKAYMKAFVELLEDIGMPDGSIVCSSIPGHGIPGGAKTFDWLREQFIDCDLRVVFALSKNYYNSPACLNEMGAAWITKATDTLMLLPGFEFADIKGCIDPTEIGIKLDGDEEELRHRLNELKDALIEEHDLLPITSARWERRRTQFITEINNISSSQEIDESTQSKDLDADCVAIQPAKAQIPKSISVEASFLVVYAASRDGQIVKLQTLSGVEICAAGKSFMKDNSHREKARWQEALSSLVSWGWIKPVGRKGEIFELTNTGYNMADRLKEEMEIDTDNEPMDELKEYEHI